MKTVIHKLTLGIAAFFAVMPAFASDDFGIWSDVTVEKSFTKKFAVDFGVGMRAENKLKSITRWDYNLGMNYEPWKFLEIDFGYSYLYNRNLAERKDKDLELWEEHYYQEYNITHGYWRDRHRVTGAITGNINIGRFNLSLREKYQWTHTKNKDSVKVDKYRLRTNPDGDGTKIMIPSLNYDNKKDKWTHYLRSRIKAEYNIRHCAITPYASIEISNSLTEGFALDKTRYCAGFNWKINKINRFYLEYIYQNGIDDDSGNSNIHVISLGYKFKL